MSKSNSKKEILQHKILALLKFDNWFKLREYSEFEIVALREKYSKHLLRFPCKIYYYHYPLPARNFCENQAFLRECLTELPAFKTDKKLKTSTCESRKN